MDEDNTFIRMDMRANIAPKDLAALKRMVKRVPQWIPVAEQLPPQMTAVLIVERDLGIMVAHRLLTFYKGWTTNGDGGILCEATHWMPLPEPPQVKP